MEKPNIVRLNIQLTKKCNQRCKSCNSYEIHDDGEMSLADIKRAVRETCTIFDIKNIAFTGGEPTLYENILEIAGYARKYSNKVSVTTNGFYCRSKAHVLSLVQAGINRFSFSYHGIGIHDQFVGVKGAEARLRKAIDWLLEIKQEFPEIYIKVGTLFNGRNISNIGDMLSFTEEKGIDLFVELLDTRLPIFQQAKHIGFTFKDEERKLLLTAIDELKKWKIAGKHIICDTDFITRYFLDLPIQGGVRCGQQIYMSKAMETSGAVVGLLTPLAI